VIEDGALVVYRPKIRPGTSGRPVAACLRGSSSRMTLGSGDLRLIATAAPVVAYVVSQLVGVDTSASELVVVDVSHRTIIREERAGHSVDSGFVFSEGVSDLVVTARGEIAWIERRTGGAVRAPEATVMAAPRSGPSVVLDEGTAVAPESLYLSGDTVHWVEGDETRAAPLP
jgi:hypothetical protein